MVSKWISRIRASGTPVRQYIFTYQVISCPGRNPVRKLGSNSRLPSRPRFDVCVSKLHTLCYMLASNLHLQAPKDQHTFLLAAKSLYNSNHTSLVPHSPSPFPSSPHSGCFSITKSLGALIQGFGIGQSLKWTYFACFLTLRASQASSPPRYVSCPIVSLFLNSPVTKKYGRCGRTSAVLL